MRIFILHVSGQTPIQPDLELSLEGGAISERLFCSVSLCQRALGHEHTADSRRGGT